MTKAELRKVKKIEAAVYPKHMQQLHDCHNLNDVADYCECETDEVRMAVGSNWYIIVAADDNSREAEVVDFAALGGRCAEPFAAWSFLMQFSGYKMSLDAKEDTSYPLVTAMAERGRLELLVDELWSWEGTAMHSISCRITPRKGGKTA